VRRLRLTSNDPTAVVRAVQSVATTFGQEERIEGPLLVRDQPSRMTLLGRLG
jgi:hypothetical protein